MKPYLRKALWIFISVIAIFSVTAMNTPHIDVAAVESTPEPTENPTDCNARWWIQGLAFSPDSQFLLSNWSLGQARLWDIQTGAILKTFYGNPETDFTSVAFSPDGSIIATADAYQAILWDTQSGEKLHTLVREIQNDVATQIIFTPDGSDVLTSGFDGATLWDVKSGKKLRSFTGVQDTLLWQYTRLSSDGKYIITFDSDNAYLWDFESGEKIHTFENQFRATFTPDASKIVTSGYEGITIWDAKSFQQINVLNPAYGRPRWALSQNGHYLLTEVTNEDGYALRTVLWDTETGMEMETKPDPSLFDILVLNENGFNLDSLLPQDNQSIISTVRNINLGWIIKTISLENLSPLRSLISPDGELLAVSTVEGTLEVWSLEDGQKLGPFC